MKKRQVLLIALALAMLAGASAQSLKPSASIPTADGTVKSGEYSDKVSISGVTLSLSLSADGKTLYVALEAPTAGWVAVGLGSNRMDGAYMVLAFDANGKTTISEETGSGHSHRTNSVKKLATGFVKESGGTTVLEFSLPSAGYVSGTSLKMILAYGQKDSLNSMHSAYFPLDYKL